MQALAPSGAGAGFQFLNKCFRSHHRGVHVAQQAAFERAGAWPAAQRGAPHALPCSQTPTPAAPLRSTTSKQQVSTLAACSTRAAALPMAGEQAVEVGVHSLRCRIDDIPGELADAMADELLGLGALSASVEEFRPEGQPEQELFGGGATREVWDRCSVAALFSAGTEVAPVLARLRALLSLPPLRYQVEQVPDQEWMDSVRASYQPVQVTDRLWIIPRWCEPPDPAAVNIVLEPGLAFGTGEHPTTRLCLRALAGMRLARARCMDYGTGSGVLAIAALKLGAAAAVGTDTDALAVQSAAANARLNSVGDRFQALQCSSDAAGPEPLQDAAPTFDVCVANILHGPLLELCPRLAAYVRPGGCILLSGILVTQWPALRVSYERYFADFEMASEGSWALVTGIRK